jgi:signal transduction histidine kinase
VSGRGGTGYGLYICKTIEEAHGGTISVTNGLDVGTARIIDEQKKGTTVTLTIPVYGGQEAGLGL